MTCFRSGHISVAAIVIVLVASVSGCTSTSIKQVREYERTGNIAKLSEVTRSHSEDPEIRRASLESLARLNWKPTNDERLQVYSLFAPQSRCASATSLMSITSPGQFSEMDAAVVRAAGLLNVDGSWNNDAAARTMYGHLKKLNNHAVTISLCQQIVAHPELQTKILLLAIKLGLPASERDLVGVLFVYGDKMMAEDYLNCGSWELADGARTWARANGYEIATGYGSHRSGWGAF